MGDRDLSAESAGWPEVLFYPDVPDERSKIFPVCMDLDICDGVAFGERFDLAFLWSHSKTGVEPDGFIRSHPEMINRGCCDISKTRVGEIFGFGGVDPETYRGPVVRKNELQCGRGETLIDCPARRETGYIYRPLINTRNPAGDYVEYRLYCFDGPRFLVRKLKREMLSKDYHTWELVPLETIPGWRLAEIAEGCRRFGLDFGELDLLPGPGPGEFTVIDVNNVAGGQGRWLAESTREIRELYARETKRFFRARMRARMESRGGRGR